MSMLKELESELVVKEIIAGIIFGIIGVGIMLILYPSLNLYYSIVLSSIAGYLFMQVGIGLMGYLTLKKIEQSSKFPQCIISSIIGLLISILLLSIIVFLTFRFLPLTLNLFILPILLPLSGSIIGFNYRFKKLIAGQITIIESNNQANKN